jgi:DNA-binding winged helix-turn-helix (wHTH) protein/tetratricopeptide (TPR) repeat protein/TolB-like protein
LDEKLPCDAPEAEAAVRLAFGAFVADPETGRLMEGDRVVPLAPKPFDTLLYLARRPGRVIPKSELMERLWAATYVTEDVLVQCVVEIRRALGDHAKASHYVQTVPRRGYQFTASVREIPPSALTVPIPPLVSAPPPAPSPPPPRLLSARWAAPAAMVLAVALSVPAWLRSGRVEPIGAANAVATEPGSLVVMPISVEEPGAQNGWLVRGLAEMIRSQLGQSAGVRVVARHRLAAALREAGYDEGAAPSADVVGPIARRLGAERLVTGSFVRVEDRFVLTAQVADVASGRSEATASVRGRHPGDLLDAVDDLCLKLVSGLGSSAGGEARKWRPARLTTRSLDASRQYVEALSWFARGGRLGADEAEKRLDEALKLDPSFAEAYLKKAEVQQWRCRWGYGKTDPAPAIRAAVRLIKDLPEPERLLVRSFEALIVAGQPSEALRLWEALVQKHSTWAEEAGVPALMADVYARMGRWSDVIAIGEPNVESLSVPEAERALLSSIVSQAYRRKGDFERALQHGRRTVHLWPSPDGPRLLSQRVWLGRLCLEAGRRDDALAEFRATATAHEADAFNFTDAAWGFYMAGETAEAEQMIERALRLDPAMGNAYHLRGWLELARGESDAAASSLETAFERTPHSFGNPHQGLVGGDLAALYYAGVARQKAGQAERARQVLERVIELCRRVRQHPPDHGVAEWQAANFLARASARLGRPAPDPPRLQGDDTTFFVQTARLHTVQGKLALALRELAQGLALGHGERRHIRDDPDFESLRDQPEFARLTEDGRSAGSRTAALGR